MNEQKVWYEVLKHIPGGTFDTVPVARGDTPEETAEIVRILLQYRHDDTLRFTIDVRKDL
jgi:hypothetical protein